MKEQPFVSLDNEDYIEMIGRNQKIYSNPFEINKNTYSNQEELKEIPLHTTKLTYSKPINPNPNLTTNPFGTQKYNSVETEEIDLNEEQESNTNEPLISSSNGEVDVETEKSYYRQKDMSIEEEILSMIPFYHIKFYQRWFNISTKEVVERIRLSLYIYKSENYECLEWNRTIAKKPDLYGPIWISTTLIFFVSVISTLIDWIASETAKVNIWTFDFTKLTKAATIVYIYAFIIPLILWIILKFWIQTDPSIFGMWCDFGYALILLLPFSILCLIPHEIMKIIAILLFFGVSGRKILGRIKIRLGEDFNRYDYIRITFFSAFFHILFCVLLKIYFF